MRGARFSASSGSSTRCRSPSSAPPPRHGHYFDGCVPEPSEYVFCSFASIAARPTADAAASCARSLSRFFLRCRRRWISVGCRLPLMMMILRAVLYLRPARSVAELRDTSGRVRRSGVTRRDAGCQSARFTSCNWASGQSSDRAKHTAWVECRHRASGRQGWMNGACGLLIPPLARIVRSVLPS